MKHKLSLLVLAVCGMMLFPVRVHANDYLEHQGHYTVQSMGNGVLRFTIPVWVYGAINDYYLESTQGRNDSGDTYVWYSTSPNTQRGSSDVHRIASIVGRRYGSNDSDSGRGEGYIYVHEGSAKVVSTYDGDPIVLSAEDDTYWKDWANPMSLKRKEDDDHKRITYITFDWYHPAALQNCEFYCGISVRICKKSSGDTEYRFWWNWSDKYKGGAIPQSPELFEPYIYAMDGGGATGHGCAAMQYAVYQDPISYHTSWNSTEVPSTDRAGTLLIPTCDTVRRFVSASFNVYTDKAMGQTQVLKTNEVHVPAYHRIYDFRGEQIVDSKGSVTGEIKLMWKINHANARDLVEGDVFEVQRAANADFSDAQTIGVKPMLRDTASYWLTDDPLTALGPDTSEMEGKTHYANVYRDVTTYDENNEPYAVYSVSLSSERAMMPGRPVYYRVRRASASVWGWDSEFAMSDTTISSDYLAPLADTLPDYTPDEAFEDNRKVHFSFKLLNNIVTPLPEPEDQCKMSSTLKSLTPAQMPIRIRATNISTTYLRPEWFQFVFSYTLPEQSKRIEVEIPVTMTNKFYGATFPGEADNLLFEVRRRSDGRSWSNTPNKGMPYVKEIKFNGQEFYEFATVDSYFDPLYDSIKTAHPLDKAAVRHELYEELSAKVASIGEEGDVRCNWDKRAILYLQRILVETGDTMETAIPSDSIVRQEDGSWLVHATSVADVPCVHYRYNIRLDQTYSLLKVMTPSALEPKPVHGVDLYYSQAAKIDTLHASQGDDRYGVLLIWAPTTGGVDTYKIERRHHGGDNEFAPLFSTTETSYRDTSAVPDEHYDYRITSFYTCHDTTSSHQAVTEGWRSPYGRISGRVHYEDGTGCPGVTVDISSQDGSYTATATTDVYGRYAFDSLRYGDGTNYTVTPTSQTAEFRYNNTGSGTATIGLSARQPVAEAIEFDNISSVRFSGRVLYKYSSIPVRDACLKLNGHTVHTAAGELHTDVSGNFELKVPKASAFTIQAVKDGHTFEGDGFVRIDGDSLITRTEALDGVRIWDNTKVRLAGRITGGLNQAAQPLGFGLSVNYLGDNLQMVLELEGDNTSWIVRDPDDLTRDTMEYVVKHEVYSLDDDSVIVTGTTRVHYQKKRIIINPDPATGEYCADIFPVRYKITQANAQGYATLFAKGKTSETMDLSDAANRQDSVLYANQVAHWNGRFDVVYRSPINISCKQMRYGMTEDFYGEQAITRQNIRNELVRIPLAERDSTGAYRYIFGAPVFASQEYRFRVTAHEDYYYNNVPNGKHEEVRIKGGTLKIYNGMHDTSNTEMQTMQLNADGQADITVPIDYVSFIKTGENALRVLDLSVETDGQYVESQALKGYVMGNRTKGRDYLVSASADVTLLDILRDPPGANSYAYIEKGTTYTYNYDYDFKMTFGLEIGASYGSKNSMNLGTYAGAGGGVYSGYIMNNEVYNNFALPITSSVVYKRNGSYSFATSERIQTGTDEFHVGDDGDVYIGATQSVYFGLLDAVRPIDSLTYASLAAQMKDSVGNTGTGRVIAQGRDSVGQTYYLVIGEETQAGVYVDGTFIYSQEFIVNTLLPKLIRQRDELLLTGDSATVQAIADAQKTVVYWSRVLPDDRTYALTNYTKLYPGGKPDKWINIDDVAQYNKQIVQWMNLIKRNEKEKLTILNGVNADQIGNYSVSDGVTESYSETYNYSSTITYRWDYPNLSPKTSLDFLHAGVASKMGEAAQAFADKMNSLWDVVDNDFISKDPTTITGDMPAAEWKFSLKPILDINFDRNPSRSTVHRKTEGFVLQTSSPSYMNVTVSRLREPDNWFNNDSEDEREYIDNGNDYNGEDHQFGSFVYTLNGGASKCPWEGPKTSLFYEIGGQPAYLSYGTLRLENPKLDIDVHERSDVPHDKPAVFNLRLSNEVQQDLGLTAIFFKLKLNESSNPKGAKIYIDGMPLTGDGRTIRFYTGQVINKTVEVYAGEDYDYENITLELLSQCDYNTDAKATFSVHYMPVSCEVNISAPHDKWVMNTLSPHDSIGYYLPVVIDGFDVNYKNFDHIEFQYKLSKQSDDAWVNVCSYYYSDSLYQSASGTKAMITSGRIDNIRFYGERDPVEQLYDLRAVSFCRHGSSYLTRASAVLTGVKDTRPPVLFGAPQPANGILGIGDDMKLRFSEPIAGNYLDEDNNFQLMGVTNRTGITASTSPHFNNRPGSFAATKVNRNLKDKAFTIDLMVKPDSPDDDVVFFRHGSSAQGFVFGKDATNHLYVQIGNSLPYKSKTLDERITAFTRVIAVFDPVDGIRFYAGTKDMTDPAEFQRSKDLPYPISAPLVFGEGMQGNLLEARVWTKALTEAEIANTHMRYLTGYERELLAYYRMNEGRGTTMTDLAHGATLYYDNADWTMQTGISLRMEAGKTVELDNRYLSRSEIQDETVMFWFRTTSKNGNLFSAARNDDGSEDDGFALRLENGRVVLLSGMETRATDKQVSDDAWHHLVLCVNRTYNNVSLFVDDDLLDNFPSEWLGAISGTMYLGGFDGYIDEFAIFEQALPESLIETFLSVTPFGDEMGLMAFLPFEMNLEGDNGILEQVFSVNDQRIFKDSEGMVVDKVVPLVLTPDAEKLADKTNHAPVRSRTTLSKMNFTWTYDDTELLINLKMADREVNKQSMFITVRAVEDLNGNPMASPVTWTAFVDRNPLKWSTKNVNVTMDYGQNATVYVEQVRIINSSGMRHTYTIESLPQWLEVDKSSGAIEPQGELTVSLKFNLQMPVGDYADMIYLTDENGLAEPLMVEYKMEAICPWNEPNDADYSFNMSVCGQVNINGTLDKDPNDCIIALFNNECVGLSHIDFNNERNTSKVFLTVFGKKIMSGREISFLLWQASTGKIFNLTTSRKILFGHGEVYGCGDDEPVIFSAAGSETQSITLAPGWNWISTNLNLKAETAPLNAVMAADWAWHEGDIIKSPDSKLFAVYSEAAGEFSGTLTGWDYSQMYMCFTSHGNTMRLSGDKLPADKMAVTLHGDGSWNVVPCLFDQVTNVTEALADYYDYATPGDLIKSHSRFAVFSTDKYWEGDLTALRPGEGYLMRRMGQGDVQVKFYNKSSGITPQKAPAFSGKAATNMTMICTLSGEAGMSSVGQEDGLHVYIGGELAGVATPYTLSEKGQGDVSQGDVLYFLTISSELPGELRFTTSDGRPLMPEAGNGESVNYEPDAHYGTLQAPVRLVAGGADRPYKIIDNDRVIIIRDGNRYDVTGVLVD